MSTEEIMKDIQDRGKRGELSERDVNSIVNLHKSLEVGESTEAFVGYRGAGFSLLFRDHNTHTIDEVKSLVGTIFIFSNSIISSYDNSLLSTTNLILGFITL